MASPQVQIIALRPDGTDPRTVVALDKFDKQLGELKTLAKAKDYPGAKVRPKLVIWDGSGAEIDPKTGRQILELEAEAEAAKNASSESTESPE